MHMGGGGSTGTECPLFSDGLRAHTSVQIPLPSRSSGWGKGISLNDAQAFISGELDCASKFWWRILWNVSGTNLLRAGLHIGKPVTDVALPRETLNSTKHQPTTTALALENVAARVVHGPLDQTKHFALAALYPYL